MGNHCKELATQSPLESTCPSDTRLPVTYSGVMDADNFADALCLCSKGNMAQETANKLCSFVKVDIEKHQAISPVTQISLVKIVIAGEKGRSALHQYVENGFSTIGAVGVA